MAAEAAEVRLAPLDHPAAPEWTAVKGAEGEGKARPLTAGQLGATHFYLRFFYYQNNTALVSWGGLGYYSLPTA